jgi:hypothetical protein
MRKVLVVMGAGLLLGSLGTGCVSMSKMKETVARAESAATRAEDAAGRTQTAAARAEEACGRCEGGTKMRK